MVSGGTPTKANGAPAPQPPEEDTTPVTCAWDHDGDECFAPVESDDELCAHHKELAARLPEPPGPPRAKRKKTPKKKAPKKAPKQERVDLTEGAHVPPEVEEPARLPQSPSGRVVRGPKTTPRVPLDERFEQQKKALQQLAVGALEAGGVHGLTATQVRGLHGALIALGWIPEGVRV